MPYIPKNERHRRARTVGDLTYAIQQELDKFLFDRATLAGIRYHDLATCLAALEGARADFERRILTPYEIKKQTENGDVWSHSVLCEIGYE